MGDTRRLTETVEALQDVQAALDVIAGHLGLEQQVREAVAARREKARRSQIEIERSLRQPDAGGGALR